MNKNNIITNIKINYYIFWTLVVFLLLVIFNNLFFSFVTQNVLEAKAAKNKELQRPANLEITVITDNTCVECGSLDGVLHAIKGQNIKITKEQNLEYSKNEAQSLLDTYSIETLPALIITGEINKNPELTKLLANIGQSDNDTFVLRHPFYPVKDWKNHEIIGLTNIYLLSDSSCKECYDVRQHLSILSSFGLNIANATTTDIYSELGKELLKKYQIDKVPTIVLTGDLDKFDNLKKVWPQVGTIAKDGTYVFQAGLDSLKVTYKDLTTTDIINFASSTSK